MREAFGVLTGLPHEWDHDQIGRGWVWTVAVGVVMGVVWLSVQQVVGRIGGPFVAAGALLLVHVVVLGARPQRGLAAVAEELTEEPDPAVAPSRPDTGGAAAAVVMLVLLMMSGMATFSADVPALLFIAPLIGRSVQVVLLQGCGEDVGLPEPSALQHTAIVALTVAALGLAPVLNTAVRPVRENAQIQGIEYVVAGLIALLVTFVIAIAWRGWLRARFGTVDANAWHSIGAVADLAALLALVGQIN
ncbi:hypothetical protein [Euzebya tangerina]|uniref:hypothetical protein n=1 Tax=Euzebya tangerina TaxID=591198 RepID=UPI000E320882|nr:hypothetical protein [Euzebya tangerina]